MWHIIDGYDIMHMRNVKLAIQTLNQTASGPQFAPNLLKASGIINPAAPSMAQRAWISS